jgi:cupin superfamily acireductone dioxygenase involved in methionine salvage
MRIVPIECPIVINKFSQHNILKDEVLREINAQQFIPINDPSASINRADWDVPRDVWKRYIAILFPHLAEHMQTVQEHLKYTRINILNIWFQQYISDTDFHDWHTHSGSNFSCVYYLELKDTNCRPQFMNIDGSVFSLDVEEGDIICFPSHIKHRSPKFTGIDRKTVVAFDCNIEIISNLYK